MAGPGAPPIRLQAGHGRTAPDGPRLRHFTGFGAVRATPHDPERPRAERWRNCNIGTLDASEIVYLDRVEAKHWPLRLQFGTRSRVPLHRTATGKLFLAFLPARQRRELLAGLELRPMTTATLTSGPALQAELAAIRKRGLSIDAEEYILGVICVAAPIFNSAGQTRAGIAVQAPSARMSVEQAVGLRDKLIAAAGQLSTSFVFG